MHLRGARDLTSSDGPLKLILMDGEDVTPAEITDVSSALLVLVVVCLRISTANASIVSPSPTRISSAGNIQCVSAVVHWVTALIHVLGCSFASAPVGLEAGCSIHGVGLHRILATVISGDCGDGCRMHCSFATVFSGDLGARCGGVLLWSCDGNDGTFNDA